MFANDYVQCISKYIVQSHKNNFNLNIMVITAVLFRLDSKKLFNRV